MTSKSGGLGLSRCRRQRPGQNNDHLDIRLGHRAHPGGKTLANDLEAAYYPWRAPRSLLIIAINDSYY